MVLVKSIELRYLVNNCLVTMFVNELIAITAFTLCAAVIVFVIRVYKESPKISKDHEEDEFGN